MDSIWWNQVSNARNFIVRVADMISSGNNILLEIPKDVPWRDEMQEQLVEILRNQRTDYSVKMLQDSEEEPGEIILNKFCKPEKVQEYRPAIGYAKFLAESDDIVLNNYFVWTTDIGPSRYEAWAQFAHEYKKALPNGKRGGVFILEMEDTTGVPTQKGIQKVSYPDAIGEYDCFVFYALVAASLNIETKMKQYLAELVTSIAGSDIELGAECIHEGRFEGFMSNPFVELKEINDKSVRSNYQDFEINHNEEEIKQKIWETQIKTIFPLIEKFRRRFVEKYSNQIQANLPITNSFGEKVTDAKEVEIGSLLYLVADDKIAVSSDEHSSLHVYTKARNDLAHLNVLNLERVEEIVGFKI